MNKQEAVSQIMEINLEELHGKVTHWLATSIVSGPYIKDEFGNELEIE